MKGAADSLARRYVVLIGGLVAALLVAAGAIEAAFAYRESREAAALLAREKASGAAARIEQSLAEIVRQLAWTTLPLPETGEAALVRRRFELRNLLRHAPAIMEARAVDAEGVQRVYVSRIERDRLGGAAGFAADPAFRAAREGRDYYGPVRFVRQSEPWMTIAATADRERSTIGIAEVDLRSIWDVVSRIRVGTSGYAYAVDREGRLVAHPDLSLVLANTNLAHLPQVRAAIDGRPMDGIVAQGTRGGKVVAASAPVASLGWHVLVEEPADEAFAPALAAATRNAVLLAFGLGIAVFSSLALARRMARSLSALQGEVAQRTGELARANEAKSRLVAATGHDLRQPLHALGLFAAQLSSKSLPADARPLAHGIEASVRSLGEMLDSLLDLSRLEAGQLEARMTDFGLDAMFDSLRRHFEPVAREKGLVLRVRAGGHIVRSDPALLERIAMNLLSNAIRYTSRGGVLLVARGRGDRLLLQVWDTGSGIAPSRQAEIFSEFVRLAGPGGRDSPGLGIGLAIVDRLSRLLDAPLRLRSREGRGSVFTIELPLGDAALARVSPARAPESLAGCVIAVVDDDPTSLSGMRGLLESWGCVVIAAASGEELLLRIGRKTPDVLISDLRLREEPGDAVVRRVRAACDAPVPAFLVSGDTSSAAARVAAEAGLAILRKPVLPMKLRAMLTHAIAGRSAVNLESTAVSS